MDHCRANPNSVENKSIIHFPQCVLMTYISHGYKARCVPTGMPTSFLSLNFQFLNYDLGSECVLLVERVSGFCWTQHTLSTYYKSGSGPSAADNRSMVPGLKMPIKEEASNGLLKCWLNSSLVTCMSCGSTKRGLIALPAYNRYWGDFPMWFTQELRPDGWKRKKEKSTSQG